MRITNYVWYQGWFPELNMLETDEERRNVLRDAQLKVGWSRVLLVLWLGFMPFAFAGRFWLVDRGMYWAGEVVFYGSMLGLPFLTTYMTYRSVQRSLRLLLLKRGMPICLHCGYDLRGTTGSRCSECGSEFEPIELASKTGDDG